MGSLVAITGGMGVGKSTVLRVLSAWGYATVSADQVLWELSQPGGVLYHVILSIFGADVCMNNGQINRPLFMQRQLHEQDLKHRWYAQSHPVVLLHAQKLALQTDKPVFVEDALLFEAKVESFATHIACVTAPMEERVARVLHRKNIPVGDHAVWSQRIRDVIADQIPLEEVAARCEIVVDNTVDDGGVGAARAILREVGRTPYLMTQVWDTPPPDLERSWSIVRTVMETTPYRVHGLGMLQFEVPPELDDGRENTHVHVWHPMLARFPLEQTGHQHRFHMDSTVLHGTLNHLECSIVPGTDYQMVAFRGEDQQDVTPIGPPCALRRVRMVIGPAQSYYMPQAAFHQFSTTGLTITLVRKSPKIGESRALFPAGATPRFGREDDMVQSLEEDGAKVMVEALAAIRLHA